MDPQIPDERLTRENAYLRQRNAQLQQDIVSATAEVRRLQQTVERIHGRSAPSQPGALGDGQ
jgi:hypothetical protein